MKLRIRGNSIRLRLSQGEVATLMAEGVLEESARFSAAPADRLTYSVKLSASAPVLSATLGDGGILVTLPKELASQWANSNQTGMDHAQPVGEGSVLRIAIEKDFRCAQPRPGENEADNFPHPDPASCG